MTLPPVIDNFRDANFFLSNFYPAPMVYDFIFYPTSEHAFVAQKTTDELIRLRIARLPTPGMAKTAGRELQLRPNWEEKKDAIMASILEVKFQDPTLRAKLLATAPAHLIEGNHWHDNYWGICRCESCFGYESGMNKLGYALQELRAKLAGEPEQVLDPTL